MAGTIEMNREEKESQTSRSFRGARKTRADQTDEAESRRFFLARPGGGSGVPEFGKEFSGESEAMVESLKTGLSYYVVSEWRGIADFSGRKPLLGREAVPGHQKSDSKSFSSD